MGLLMLSSYLFPPIAQMQKSLSQTEYAAVIQMFGTATAKTCSEISDNFFLEDDYRYCTRDQHNFQQVLSQR